MTDEEVRLGAVYGISRDVPLNYSERRAIDGSLIESLTRDKHIVIHGSSKQGKTCLRKWNLIESDYIVVTCSNKWDLSQLHSAILKAAGFTVEQSSTRTVAGENKISARIEGKLKLGVAELGSNIGSQSGDTDTEQVVEAPLELDPADVNDIIAALKAINFSKYIVLEDFHYLTEEVQKDFSVALKAFHEASDYCFIVVGVWLDENRLIQFNGDLAGRVIAINADAWSEDELLLVIAKGERLMNVTFDESFKRRLVEGCFESIYVVQESCYKACETAGVYFRQDEPVIVGADLDAVAIIREVVNSQSARYNTFISNFAGGFVATQLEMYKWMLVPVLTASAEKLEKGLPYAELRKAIDSHHPESPINPGNLTQALQSTASLQVKLNISSRLSLTTIRLLGVLTWWIVGSLSGSNTKTGRSSSLTLVFQI